MRGGNVWFSPIPVATAALLVLIALVVLTLADAARGRRGARWLLVACVVAILAVTMLRVTEGTRVTNLHPGHTIGEQLTGEHALGLFNVLGNIAMFVPLGWLVALLAHRSPVLTATTVAVSLSALIEVIQTFTSRIADIDDAILNGCGGVLGACLAVAIRAVRPVSAK